MQRLMSHDAAAAIPLAHDARVLHGRIPQHLHADVWQGVKLHTPLAFGWRQVVKFSLSMNLSLRLREVPNEVQQGKTKRTPRRCCSLKGCRH